MASWRVCPRLHQLTTSSMSDDFQFVSVVFSSLGSVWCLSDWPDVSCCVEGLCLQCLLRSVELISSESLLTCCSDGYYRTSNLLQVTPLLQKFYCFLLCLLGTLSDSARIFASMKGRIAEQPVGVEQTTLIKFVSFS